MTARPLPPDRRGRADGTLPIEDPSVALDPVADPGGAAFGTTGAEASVDLPWPAMLSHRVRRRAEASPRHRWWVLLALLAGLFALNFTFTVFVVALPTVKAEFHTDFSVLTWVSTGPLLAFGLAAPIFGKAGDMFGYRRLYLWGLAGAMVAAVLTALAPNVWVLVLARSLDGVEGAATGTASMALILQMFAPEDRVKAMGWWSMVGAGGPVIGVTIGSPIIEYLGWRSLFWIQLVLIVLSFVVVALVLPSPRHRDLGVGPGRAGATAWRRHERLDWIGSWSLSGSVTGAMLVLSLGPVIGWASAPVVASGVLALAAMALFVHRERTGASPLIPPEYFRRRNFVFPMGTQACVNFAYFGAFFLFPLMMEEVYHWTVTEVGIVSIARPLVYSVCSPVAGYATVRVGERASAVAGAAAVVVSMALFASLGGSPNMALIVLALGLAGLGMGVSSPATSSVQASVVDPTRFGVASAAQQLASQVGEVAGIQVLITVQESLARRNGGPAAAAAAEAVRHASLLATFHDAFWSGAGVAAGAVACALCIRRLARRGPGRQTQMSGPSSPA